MKKEDTDPDALTIIFLAHLLKKNITLVSGKGEEWKTDDVADDIVLLYKGDNKYSPTDVGTYQFKYKILIFWLRQLIFFSSAHKLSCTANYI